MQRRRAIPLYRDVRVRRVAIQAAALIVVGVLIVGGLRNYLTRGLAFSFSFLQQEASFDLAEGIDFSPSDSYAKAFLVGVVNTLRIAAAGIVLASALGFVAGVARLSTNWLVRSIATVYVEAIRNTPLLVQLFFLYFAVILRLPRVADAVRLPGPILLSNRGVVLPRPFAGGSFLFWTICIAVGIAMIAIAARQRKRQMNRKGKADPWTWIVTGIGMLIPVLSWFIFRERPIVFDLPAMVTKSGGVVRVEGGRTLSSEFTALLTGLVIYTGAYIAEVVRGGIQAVPKGQTEAARSQGFTSGQITRLIVLPQALRIIIPPLISQYLNLTKNSSLAIAIGFLDVYAVSQTMLNQSGRVVEVFLMIMATYLSISLLISLIMNIVNRRIQIVER